MNKKYWLTGGKIGFFIIWAVFFEWIIYEQFSEDTFPEGSHPYIVAIAAFGFWSLILFMGGAIIGWIYGKMKNRKKFPSSNV